MAGFGAIMRVLFAFTGISGAVTVQLTVFCNGGWPTIMQ